MSDAILRLQSELLFDPSARRRFAKDPASFCAECGVDLPDNLKIPDQIELEALNTQLDIAKSRLERRGISMEEDGLIVRSPENANRVLSDVFAPEVEEMEGIRARVDAFRGRIDTEATVAVMAAVVEVVVVP